MAKSLKQLVDEFGDAQFSAGDWDGEHDDETWDEVYEEAQFARGALEALLKRMHEALRDTACLRDNCGRQHKGKLILCARCVVLRAIEGAD